MLRHRWHEGMWGRLASPTKLLMVTLQSLVSLNKSFDSYFMRKTWPTRAIFWFYLLPSRALYHFFFLRKWRLSVGLLPGKNGNSRAVLHTMWHALSNLQAFGLTLGSFFVEIAGGLWWRLMVYDWFSWQCHWKCWKWSTRKAVYLCMQCMFSLQLSAGEGFTSRHISLGWLHTDDSISSAQLWNRCQLLNQPKGPLNVWTMGACQPKTLINSRIHVGFSIYVSYWQIAGIVRITSHVVWGFCVQCHSNLTPLGQRSRDPSFKFVAYELTLSASLEGEKTNQKVWIQLQTLRSFGVKDVTRPMTDITVSEPELMQDVGWRSFGIVSRVAANWTSFRSENEVPLYSEEETTRRGLKLHFFLLSRPLSQRIILCWCILWVAASIS